ncbi:class I SAM-dependent methyltransferase [soil metagenome]
MTGESFLRAFHARRPGVTAKAFARGGSYARLAERISHRPRVLDLACGDGALLSLLGARAVGIDAALDELRELERAGQARAQALPFADHSFDAVACHLAFMLFDELPRVVAELERVLVPGGEFVAVLGGGPTAEGDDAFHRFLAILDRSPSHAPRLGDRRARSEQGWRELMPGWQLEPFERWQLDLGGTFDEVWEFLGSSYEVCPDHAEAIRGELRASSGEHVACNAVVYLASATAPQ